LELKADIDLAFASRFSEFSHWPSFAADPTFRA
jgi:hypothetical protein